MGLLMVFLCYFFLLHLFISPPNQVMISAHLQENNVQGHRENEEGISKPMVWNTKAKFGHDGGGGHLIYAAGAVNNNNNNNPNLRPRPRPRNSAPTINIHGHIGFTLSRATILALLLLFLSV